MKVLICGSRYWTNRTSIRNVLWQLKSNGYDTLIEGECRGADIISREEAEKIGFNIMESKPGITGFPADWDTYHKAAGHIRNKQMLDEGKPDLVVAFHEEIENSKGTKNMINQARKAGIKVILVEN